jgi:hypothetical protein
MINRIKAGVKSIRNASRWRKALWGVAAFCLALALVATIADFWSMWINLATEAAGIAATS